MIVVTEELLRSTAPGAEASFGKHLRAAVAATLDSDFLATVAAGATVTLATASPMADLRNLLNTVNTAGAAHRPYWIMVPTDANLMSTLTWANGGRLFPEMTPTGGTILGLPAVVTTGAFNVGGSPAVDSLMLIDGAGIAADLGGVQIDMGRHATADRRRRERPARFALASECRRSVGQNVLRGAEVPQQRRGVARRHCMELRP